MTAVILLGLWWSTPPAAADDPIETRYAAAFACEDPSLDLTATTATTRETQLVVANPHDHRVDVEISTGAMTVRHALAPGGRLVVDCREIRSATDQPTGVLDIRPNAPVDIVAMYATTVDRGGAPGTPLVSVTFQAQLERTPRSDAERAALSELGIVEGKAVTLLALTDAAPGALIQPRAIARSWLTTALAGELERTGLSRSDAQAEASRIVSDEMRLWVMVGDTDVAVHDADVAIAVVPIQPLSPAPSTADPPVVPQTTTPTCCASCCPHPTGGTVVVIDGEEPTWSWLAAATGFAFGWLLLLLLGLLLLAVWWLLRRIRPPNDTTDAYFEIACRALGEREIDVDDRTAMLEIAVELVGRLPEVHRLVDGTLTLTFDFTGQRVAFEGSQRGRIVRSLGALYWRSPVVEHVRVATGLFANVDQQPPEAAAGVYWFDAEVTARPDPAIESIDHIVTKRRLSFDIAPD